MLRNYLGTIYRDFVGNGGILPLINIQEEKLWQIFFDRFGEETLGASSADVDLFLLMLSPRLAFAVDEYPFAWSHCLRSVFTQSSM